MLRRNGDATSTVDPEPVAGGNGSGNIFRGRTNAADTESSAAMCVERMEAARLCYSIQAQLPKVPNLY